MGTSVSVEDACRRTGIIRPGPEMPSRKQFEDSGNEGR
jgi:hypothetical protein